MTAAEQLRAAWDDDASARKEWREFQKTKTWQKLSALLKEEAVESARSFAPRMDLDPILARNAVRLDGECIILDKLQNASNPKPAPVPEPEPYDEDYIKKLKARKSPE